VVPVTLPWEDVEVRCGPANWTGLPGWAYRGYTRRLADVTNYFLTNNISGALVRSYFANEANGIAVAGAPQDAVQTLAWDSSNYYASMVTGVAKPNLRVNGTAITTDHDTRGGMGYS